MNPDTLKMILQSYQQNFSYSSSIFVGVLSGLITALFIFALSKFLLEMVVPWYQNVVFRGLDVSGSWTNEISSNGIVVSEQVLELDQKGHNINGQMSAILKLRTPNVTVSYSIKGELFDNYLFLRYKPVDKRHLGGGAVMLKIVEGGSKLQGALMAIDRYSSDIIVSDSSIWIRHE